MLGLFLLQKIEVVFFMKRNIRYFIAAVQNFYMECTVKLMDMGKGYIHPEEYYIRNYFERQRRVII